MSEEEPTVGTPDAPLYVSEKPAKAKVPKRRNSKRQVIAARKVARAVKRAGNAAEQRRVLEDSLETVEDVEIDQEEDNRPGRHIGGEKIAWKESDLLERWPVVAFVPSETLPISFNGIRYQMIAGRECHVPSVIVRQYNDRVKAKTDPAKDLLQGTGFNTVVELGAGPLGPDPSLAK